MAFSLKEEFFLLKKMASFVLKYGINAYLCTAFEK